MLIFAFVFSFSEIASASVSINAFQDSVLRDYLRQFDNGWHVGGDRWVGGHDDILSNIEIAQINAVAIRGAGLRSLEGIEYLTALTELQCPHNQVNELDLSKSTTLQWVWCGDNPLTDLNVSGLGALWYLNCMDTKLTNLDVSELTALREVYLVRNPLKDINLSGCTALEYLNIMECDLISLDVSECTALMRLYCASSKLTSLNVSGLTALTILECDQNQLTILDVGGFTALTKLWCWKNQIKNLDVSRCSALTQLWSHENQLTELNVSDCKALTDFSCSDNSLKKLDVSQNTALTCLNCGNNHLTELDLSKNIKLTAVDCSPQTREGMKVKITNEGYEVDLSEYVTKLENVVWDSIRFGEKIPISFDAGSGIVVFSECPSEVFYCYNTHSPNETYMEVTIKTEGGTLKVEALERGNLGTDSVPYADNIICDMTPSYYLDNKGQKLTEATIAGYDYGTYGKLGFTADGNSRLILRVQTDKPGYATFSVDDIGATLENLDRNELGETSQVRTSQVGSSGKYQASVVLIAPEMFPENKKFPEGKSLYGGYFPSDTFNIHVNFYADDGTTAERDIELNIEPTPVILIHRLFGSERDFISWNFLGIYGSLRSKGFDVDFFKYSSLDGLKRINAERLRSKLWSKFNEYHERRIVCTRADIVGLGTGGLIGEEFCKLDPSNDDGSNWSTISYKQRMVRRLIAVAAPHHGTPWVDYADLTEKADELSRNFILIMKFLILEKIYNIPSKLNFPELTTTKIHEMPSDVPMYVIYGNVKGRLQEFCTKLGTIATVVNGIAWRVGAATAVSKPEIAAVMTVIGKVATLAGEAALLGVGIATFIDNKVFEGQEHDFVVSSQSAVGNLTSAVIGFRYIHPNICKQSDVGEKVVFLLRGPVRNFEVINNSNYRAAPKTMQIVSESPENSSDTANDFKFIEAIKLSVSPASFVIANDTPTTVTFTITADESMHEDVYCVINIDQDDNRIFMIPSSDKVGDKFEVNLEFTSQDTGSMNVFCFSHNPNDTDGTSLLVSNTAQLTVVPDLADVNIVGINFAGNPIYTNVSSGTTAGLYAIADGENYYEISSPLTGTEWTADDPEIAIVNNEGRVQGLKEGTTTLRAEFNGLTAAISVDVGPAYEDSDDEPEPEPQPQPTPDNHTSRNSGGGCNSSSLGICALLLLFKKKR